MTAAEQHVAAEALAVLGDWVRPCPHCRGYGYTETRPLPAPYDGRSRFPSHVAGEVITFCDACNGVGYLGSA